MKTIFLASLCVAFAVSTADAAQRRIKDITAVEHDRSNVITGFGLVTGLNGTGGTIPPTREFFVDLLQKFGRPVDPTLRAALRRDNLLTTVSMSLVHVSAEIKTTAAVGTKIDVTVSSLDGATDLNNGILAATPLHGMDDEVYALAYGRVTTGGISASGAAASVQKNHPTTAYAHADIEKRVKNCFPKSSHFRLLLRHPDRETASQMVNVINKDYFNTATIDEPGIVRVAIPPRFLAERDRFISMVQKKRVQPDVKAKVVINPSTGTIIVTDKVTISAAAINHGNISVITGETPLVSQPLPLSRGQTTVVPRTEIDVVEDRTPITVLRDTTTVAELAEALNALGASPQDLTSIFRELQKAEALNAELIID